MQRTILTSCLVGGVVLLLVSIYLGIDLVHQRRTVVSEAKESARQQAVDTAKSLNEELEQYAKLANDLASDLGADRNSVQELAERLERDLALNPNLLSIGVAHAPSASSDGRISAPYYERRGDELHLLQLDDTTSTDNTWFVEAMEGRAGWREPIWDGSRQGVTATYSTPFPGSEKDEGQGPAGVVWISLTMDPVEKRLHALELGGTGYAGIISKEGYPLVFPSPAMVANRVSFFDLPEAQSDPTFRAAIENATRGESGSIERDNRLTGQSSWFFWEPVAESGWSMVIALIKDEIAVDQKAFRRRIIWITVCSIFGLIGVATSGCIRLHHRYPRNAILWVLVAFSATLMVTGMFLIRHIVFQQPSHEEVDHVVIVDRPGLDAFLTAQFAGLPDESSTQDLPTGIYLQSMKLVGPNEVFITGYVWQKYDANGPTDSDPGFVLPDATDPRITEAYRHENNGVVTVGWYVETILRQNLNMSRYPLDHDEISIRFKPKGLNQRRLLIPDFDSYTLTHPAARPGLDRKLLVAGWKVVGSFFDYKFEKYTSNLGIPGRIGGALVPELNFNIRIQRFLLDVVISNGIPLITVLIMLFAILVSSTRNEEESKLLGFNPSGVMRVASALFFIVLLAHIQLRNTVQAQQVVFMEYIYFVVYLTILLVSLHSFLFSLERYNQGRLGYRDGLVQKLLFWPLVSGSLLLITILHFY